MGNQNYSRALRDNQVSLVNGIMPTLLVGFLLEENVIMNEEAEEIKDSGTKRNQSRALIDTVDRRGEEAYNAFLLGIKACGQLQLYKKLADIIPPTEPPNLRDKLKAHNSTQVEAVTMLQDDARTKGRISDFYVHPAFEKLVWRFQGWFKSAFNFYKTLNQSCRTPVRITIEGERLSGKTTVTSWMVDQWIKGRGPLSTFPSVVFISEAIL